MRPASEVLRAELTLKEARGAVAASAAQTWPVVAQEGVIGVLTRRQVDAALEEKEGVVGALIKGAEFPHLHTDHSLDLALDRFGASHLDLLPVVSRANLHELLGIIRLGDVLEAYGVGLKPAEQAKN
jgi:predicted transcriptional regulator